MSTSSPHNGGSKKGYSLVQVVQLMLLIMIMTMLIFRQPPSSISINSNSGVVDSTTPTSVRGAGSSAATENSFDIAAALMYDKIVQGMASSTPPRNEFVLDQWKQRTTGGLVNADRVLLAKYYRQANSVFEYGLGESTYIANHVGVPRYAGIDSDVAYVDGVRQNVSSHFRFYYGDIGDTGAWGMPLDSKLPKSVWQYQVAPLQSELLPFDVYMVDGRFRVACVLLSFLHASARGAAHDATIVLMHDCDQPGFSPPTLHKRIGIRNYTVNDDILQLKDHSRKALCVYQRKSSTTDAMLLERYKIYATDTG